MTSSDRSRPKPLFTIVYTLTAHRLVPAEDDERERVAGHAADADHQEAAGGQGVDPVRSHILIAVIVVALGVAERGRESCHRPIVQRQRFPTEQSLWLP